MYFNEKQSDNSQIGREKTESLMKEDQNLSKDDESFMDELTSSRNEKSNQYLPKSSQFNTLISSNFIKKDKCKSQY